MKRRFGFKPSLRKTMLGNAAYMAAMGDGTLPPDLAASMESTLPKAPKPRAAANKPRQLETPVIAAISELLAVHPAVYMALRMNSGAASYEAASGKYAPVQFHRWLRYPEKMRMPDFIGWLKDGRSFAIEAKKPTWTRPHDDREREQAIFLEAIRKLGGTAGFARSTDEARIIIEA